MPIYEQSYRNYEGKFQSHFRWAIICAQELRVLSKARVFQFLMISALFHCLLRVFQVVAFDMVAQDPNHPFRILSQFAAFKVDDKMFLSFIQIQTPLVFIITLYAGTGMICNDFRNNLMEMYFSKPISWRDYALGKLFILVFVGLAITAIPAIFLIVLHNLLLPSMALFQESLWWILAAAAYSLVVVVPCATATLASSAVFNSQNFAAISLISLLIADRVLGSILYEALSRNYGIVSLPLAIKELGNHLFGQSIKLFEMHWIWPLLFVATVCLVASLIVVRKVRRAEVAA